MDKRCSKCGKVKNITEFRKRSQAGYKSAASKCQCWCRKCEKYYISNEAPNAFWTKLKYNLKKHYDSSFSTTPTELKNSLGYPEVCYICGEHIQKNAEIDHVVPASQGGETKIANLKWAHRQCNRMKHDLTLEEMFELMEKILSHRRDEIG